MGDTNMISHELIKIFLAGGGVKKFLLRVGLKKTRWSIGIGLKDNFYKITKFNKKYPL